MSCLILAALSDTIYALLLTFEFEFSALYFCRDVHIRRVVCLTHYYILTLVRGIPSLHRLCNHAS